MEPEGAQVGAGFRDGHRKLVRAYTPVFLPLEKEYAAFLEVGGKHIDLSDEACGILRVRALHKVRSEVAQQWAFAFEYGFKFLGELLLERERQVLLAYAALLM